MRNAEEHAKLLAQIAELEKNSVNYFDVEKEFFLIDSNNLAEVKTRLYGYSIQATGIYEQDNLTEEAVAGLDGRGCYVYVENRDGQITIKQDLNGCWGIYLFRHGNYFALSNSFFRLLDHIKFKYPLTVNRDYCHDLMCPYYSIFAYSETAVNEITSVDRNATLTISVAEKSLLIEIIEYKEHSLYLNSDEGISTLDRWFEFWTNLLHNVIQNTKFFVSDLSGGFDSRISLTLLLHSCVDFNKISIYSANKAEGTFLQDYKIATQIAEYYAFNLNKSLPQRQFLNISLTDVWNMDLYVVQTFSLLSHLHLRKAVDKCYHLNGAGGEGIRDTFNGLPRYFLKKQINKTSVYSHTLASKVFHSIEAMLESGYRSIQSKCKIKDPDDRDITLYLPRETFCVHHNGKGSTSDYFHGTRCLSPIYDPELYKLQLYTQECPDPMLLIALIFSRFEPNLLKFPFDSNHSIAPETIAYAKKINESFPRRLVTNNEKKRGVFHLQPRDLQAEKILVEGKNNPNIPGYLPNACLKTVFESSKTYGLLTSYFSEEFYRYAATFYDNNNSRRDRPLYAVTGVAKVVDDVEISRRNHPPYRDMYRFLEQDFAIIHKYTQISDDFKYYLTARIDIRFLPKTAEGDFQIVSVSDEKAHISKPDWLQLNGNVGYVINSYAGKMKIVVKSNIDGKIQLWLLGLDVRKPEDNSKRIPHWIDYTKLTVNDNIVFAAKRLTVINKIIFDSVIPAWHDKPYRYNLDVKANEEIKIQVEWLPHRSDT